LFQSGGTGVPCLFELVASESSATQAYRLGPASKGNDTWNINVPSAIAAITTAINDAPATCKVIIVPLRGAVSRVSMTDTAFALRSRVMR